MGKVLGIIAEYNPFHNGHLHHLQVSKNMTEAEHTIAIISGNFTQRGDTSIIDKWSKAQIAIENGVDLVIELPTLYSVSSAENFADGAVKILNSLGIVDFISFGSECNDIEILNDIANILHYEPKEYKKILSEELKTGISYPSARQNALQRYLENDAKYFNVLKEPNNILGIEYLKALKKNKSSIIPITIQREAVDYSSKFVRNNIASSTAIRDIIQNNRLELYKKVMPVSSYNTVQDKIRDKQIITNLSVFEKEIIYSIRKMSIEEIKNIPDVSEGLENALKNAANSSNTLSDFINIVQTKRYTRTRIQRILVYILLGITKQDMEMSKKTLPYVRILGFNNNGKKMLSQICINNPDLAVITSVKKFVDENKNKNLKSMLEKDILATDVFTLGYTGESWANLDFTHNLVLKK